MKQQSKIMFTEERGNNLYLVARGTKMLNSIERHNLKKWGFRTTDRKEYALDLGRSSELPGLRSCRSMMATLRGFGFAEVDREIATRATSPTNRSSASKVNHQLCDEEAARYSRQIETGFRYNSREAFRRPACRAGLEAGRLPVSARRLSDRPAVANAAASVHPNAAFLVWLGAM